MDLRALPRRGQFPVAVDIAIPVEPAAEAGFLIGFAEARQIRFAEPMRQRTVTLRIAEKALAVLDEQRRGGLGESALQNDTQRQINVAFELGFGNAGFLKILPIEIGDTVVAQRIERPAAAPERRRNTQARN